MPPPNYLQPNYLGAMDQSAYFAGLDMQGPVYNPLRSEAEGIESSGLTPRDLGMTNLPSQNQLQAMQAKIREGAGKIEFEFSGRQKGNAQASTPESYGKDEREMMRQIAALNKIKTSTHATFTVSGLAGFNPQQGGFNKQQQHETMHEVERAIDFAKDATTGGAIVVHTGEWRRPISHFFGKEGRIEQEGFNLYEGEDEEEGFYVVDPQGGRVINIWPGQPIVAPDYHTAESYEKVLGKDIVGKGVDINNQETEIAPDDYVDVLGRKIPDVTKTRQAFKRVPKFKTDEDGNPLPVGEGFAASRRQWEDIERETAKYNELRRQNGEKEIDPEVYAARLQLENQILQSRGQSTFYLQNYKDHEKRLRAVTQKLQYYENLAKNMTEEEKKQKLRHPDQIPGLEQEFQPGTVTDKITALREAQESAELALLHAHEASGAADARATELEQQMDRLDTVEHYGLDQTGTALGRLAEQAMQATKEAKKMREGTGEEFEDLYIAPENVFPQEYGSHPEELRRIVQAGRDKFVETLTGKYKKDQKEAEELAKKHIKTTFDIGHLNMWRNMMDRKEGESEEKFQKRFNKWLFKHLDQLDEEGMIGHLHITDNMGFNDEHLTLGQGNAPVKAFVEWAKKKGHTDFIIEAGSFNGNTIMHDAWSYLGAVNWKSGRGPQFRNQHSAHFGLYAPPNYMVGSYVPSNEWTLWSQVPLE